MHQRDAQIGTGTRHGAGGLAIDPGGQRLFLLGAVDGRICGGVDHDGGFESADRLGAGRGVGEIGLGAGQGGEPCSLGCLTLELDGDLAGLAEDEDHFPLLHPFASETVCRAVSDTALTPSRSPTP